MLVLSPSSQPIEISFSSVGPHRGRSNPVPDPRWGHDEGTVPGSLVPSSWDLVLVPASPVHAPWWSLCLGWHSNCHSCPCFSAGPCRAGLCQRRRDGRCSSSCSVAFAIPVLELLCFFSVPARPIYMLSHNCRPSAHPPETTAAIWLSAWCSLGSLECRDSLCLACPSWTLLGVQFLFGSFLCLHLRHSMFSPGHHSSV